ncbi:MAG: hypothetical protein F4X67_08860 [Gemmatimonadales bacterium]|nr:hypothetical protein [Gemmatimonadales bacterium]
MKPTPQTRNDVWERLRDSEVSVRYYSGLSSEANAAYAKFRKWVWIASGASVVLGAVGILIEAGVLAEIISGAAVVAVLVAAFLNSGGWVQDALKKGLLLDAITPELWELSSKTKTLWSDLNKDGADDEEIRRRFERLEEAGRHLNMRIKQARLTTDSDLLSSTTRIVHELLEVKYRGKEGKRQIAAEATAAETPA